MGTGKKATAFVLTVLIVLLWVITLHGIGSVGPISKDIKLGLDIKGGVYVVLEAQTEETDQEQLRKLMEQTQSVIENRVNEMGLSEPIVTIEGDKRIRVELPGAENADEAIQSIGKTAQLRFLLADGTEALSGADIDNSGVQRSDKSAQYVVTLEFKPEGQQKFFDATTKAYNKSITDIMPVVTGSALTDATVSDAAVSGAAASTSALGSTGYRDKAGNVINNPNGFSISANQIIIVLDNKIISAPGVNNGAIDSRSAVIEEFSIDEANELSMLIRGGALPTDLKEVESSEIGASIGMDALTDSVMGGAIGVLLVILLMLIMYRIFGLAANIALLMYIPLVLWFLSITGAVLTLPGVAGIVLSVGMAVDANVIIISRIREEVGHGMTVRLARREGYKRALSAVLDSQITTIIACLVLYQLGTGPVKGFAFTLASGIIIGLGTALLVANVYTDVFIESPLLRKPKMLGVTEGETDQHTELRRKFHFVKHRRKFYIVTVAILIVGLGMGIYQGQNNTAIPFGNEGIDFSGGTRVQLHMDKQVSDADLEGTLHELGLADAEVVRYGSDNQGVIIKTKTALESEARTAFLSKFLAKYDLTDANVDSFEQFGPSVGRMLTEKAIQAVLWAALFMLLYITVRFKWRFGVASVVAVFHDVLVLLAMYGIFSFTINNPFIAAVLTVVGYSITDTIVIFDRVRENFKTLSNKMPLPDLIDKSINQTLVRSLMTCACTLIVMIPLLIFGGQTIREFTVPLMIGIIAGACSSLFIASPIYYELTHIGEGGEGVSGHKRSRTNYEESVAQSKAAKKALRNEAEAKLREEAAAKGLKDIGTKEAPDAENDREKNDKNKPKPPSGGGGKSNSKKSRKKRKSSRSGGAVV